MSGGGIHRPVIDGGSGTPVAGAPGQPGQPGQDGQDVSNDPIYIGGPAPPSFPIQTWLPIFLLEEAADGEPGIPIPGQQGAAGPAGTGASGPPGQDGQDVSSDEIYIGGPTPLPSVIALSYSPGSFLVPTENYVIMANHLKLTGAQRATISGTGRLRIT